MKKILFLGLAFALVGCSSLKGSSENVNFERYSLVENLKAEAFYDNDFIDLKLKDDLNNGGIVLQTSEVSLVAANHHLWSTRLDEQLKAILSSHFQKANVNTKQKVKVFVNKFYGSLDGKVIIEALVKSNNFKKSYEFNGFQKQDGYSFLVKELQIGFNQICEEITLDLTK